MFPPFIRFPRSVFLLTFFLHLYVLYYIAYRCKKEPLF
nr:MAG TPA: hypothetical protein [Caudoviricetes sp.]